MGRKRGRVMHQVIIEAIEKLGGQPFLWELEDVTHLPSHVIKSQLGEYPCELLITSNEKKVLENFQSGLPIKHLAEIIGLTGNTTQKLVKSLSERNMIDYKVKHFDKDDDTKATHIEVITSKIFKIKKNEMCLKGARGYISRVFLEDKCDECIVYMDCKPYKVKLKSSEYSIIGG